MAPITLKDVLYMQLKKPELAGMLADCCGEVGGGDSARMLTEAAFESNVAGAFARVKVNVTTDGVKKAVGRMCRIVKVVPGSEVYQIDGVSTAKLLEITFSGKVITVKMTQLNDTAITQADLDQWLATFSTNPTGGAPQTLPTKSGVLQKWIAIKNLRETRQKRALEKQGGAVEQAPAFSPPMETGGGGGGLTPPPLPVSAPGAVQSGVPASGFTPPMPHMGVQQQQQQHHQQHLPTIPALPTTPPPPPAPPQMQDAPLSAPPPPAPLPTVPSLPFIPSAFWTGQKEGYYFGTGTSGTGYFADPLAKQMQQSSVVPRAGVQAPPPTPPTPPPLPTVSLKGLLKKVVTKPQSPPPSLPNSVLPDGRSLPPSSFSAVPAPPPPPTPPPTPPPPLVVPDAASILKPTVQSAPRLDEPAPERAPSTSSSSSSSSEEDDRQDRIVVGEGLFDLSSRATAAHQAKMGGSSNYTQSGAWSSAYNDVSLEEKRRLLQRLGVNSGASSPPPMLGNATKGLPLGALPPLMRESILQQAGVQLGEVCAELQEEIRKGEAELCGLREELEGCADGGDGDEELAAEEAELAAERVKAAEQVRAAEAAAAAAKDSFAEYVDSIDEALEGFRQQKHELDVEISITEFEIGAFRDWRKTLVNSCTKLSDLLEVQNESADILQAMLDQESQLARHLEEQNNATADKCRTMKKRKAELLETRADLRRRIA